MTSIQLYKFITDNGLEWRWELNEGEEDVILFLPFYLLDEFTKLTNWSDDWVYECVLKSNCIVLFIQHICDWHGLDIEDIFDKKGSSY